MRNLLLTISVSLIALPAVADDITTQLNATSATIYPQGASVTYFADLDLPQGSHRVLLPYNAGPYGFTPPQLKVSGGVSVGAINLLEGVTYDPDPLLTPQQANAKAAFEVAEDAIAAKQVEIDSLKRSLAALDMQAAFLASISGAEVENPDVEQMRAISQMILAEAEGAISRRLEIGEQFADMKEELGDLNDALEEAHRLYMRLSPPTGEGGMLAISVEVASGVSARFQVEWIISDASWNVAYDFRLTYGDAPALEVERKVAVTQGTGQTWPDIDLTLSTASPFSQAAPSEVGGNLASVFEVLKNGFLDETRASGLTSMMEEPVMESEVDVAGYFSAAPVVQGLSLSYVYPRKVTLADGEKVLLTLDSFSLPVETSLRAIPRRDATAFVMAKITNDLKEPLLPGEVSFYRDGSFIGRGGINMLPAGGEADLPFGSFEGIRLTHTNLRKETGDKGLISTTNTREDIVEFSVENLTGEPQDVRALFALPFSQQEDLEVSTRVNPQPNETDVEDQRGVAAWDMRLAAGETQKVRLTTSLSWPEGQMLNWNP